jgi:hypothetical protein
MLFGFINLGGFMKKWAGFFKCVALGGSLLLVLVACDSRLKEHPLPPELKRQLEMKNNPALQAKAISGVITVDPVAGAKVKMTDSASLFIFLRAKGVEGGPPLAVKRLSGIKFPYEYQIGPWDAMVPGTQLDGELTLTARLDQDGDAKASPGDVDGSRVVLPGDKHADIVLDHVVPGTPEASATVSGTVSVDPSVQSKVPRNATLFIFARAKGTQGGPPLAVQRLTEIQFPYIFKIGQPDVMVPGVRFAGELTLTARIDRDGNAKASPGDIEGSLETAVGKENVNVTLNRILP